VEDLMSYARVQRAEGIAEGEAKGRAEGRAEGIAEGKAEMAKAMKNDGMSLEVIARYSGLSESEIKSLT
ncbi:MAG: hypothetical protein MJY41_03990, partial [Bacteroidales bacterium]|nr:hypothetical protein [Bacteroidales bacterium]